jgi:predicted Ser/Thr protein kinase
MNCYQCATPVPDASRFCSSCGADLSGESAERTQPVEPDYQLEAKLREDLAGEFAIERELGRGGMAVVYLGRDAHLGRRVAIKVLPLELTFGTGIVERFKREAKTAASLDHPHIIPIHRVSTGAKLFWYAMKYVEGESLADVLRSEGPVSVGRAVQIVTQVSSALDYAHRRGVIHRDIKPANIMIDAEGWVTVTDFGIAKALGTESLTGSGSMIGTPYYMSPEQCAGKKAMPASDQYSLGVVAYQMLSGHLPFTGESVIDIIKKHCMDPPPPLGVLCPSAPPGLVAVITRTLAKSPDERFTNVAEFAGAFARAAGGEMTGEHVVRSGERPGRASDTEIASPIAGTLRFPDASQPGAAPQVALPGPAPARRAPRRAGFFVAGAVVLALGGLGLWLGPRWRSILGREVAAGGDSIAVAPTPFTPTRDTTAAAPADFSTALASSLADSTRPDTSKRTDAAPVPAAETNGRLVLRGVPAGAVVALDGVQMRGNSFAVSPVGRHAVTVSLAGFETWTVSLRVRRGQALARVVSLRPAPQATPQQVAASVPARPPAVPSTTAVVPRPAVALPAPAQPAPAQPGAPLAGSAGSAHISVASRPLSAMTINGRPVPANPVFDFEVPAGTVRIHFAWTDSTIGLQSYDTVVVVAPGERRNIGRVPLPRRP